MNIHVDSENDESQNIEPEKVRYSRDELKAKSSELRKKGYYQPMWTERGGKNSQLILDMEKPYNEARFARFKESQMNYNSIIPKTKNILKYPQYVVIDKIDKHLVKEENKKSGLEDCLPTKEFLKRYLLHIDPDDELGCWTSFTNYKGQTNAGKEQYFFYKFLK